MNHNRPHVADIFAGIRPVDNLETRGYEPKENWGTLGAQNGGKGIRSEQGHYYDYCVAFVDVAKMGVKLPVILKGN